MYLWVDEIVLDLLRVLGLKVSIEILVVEDDVEVCKPQTIVPLGNELLEHYAVPFGGDSREIHGNHQAAIA